MEIMEIIILITFKIFIIGLLVYMVKFKMKPTSILDKIQGDVHPKAMTKGELEKLLTDSTLSDKQVDEIKELYKERYGKS